MQLFNAMLNLAGSPVSLARCNGKRFIREADVEVAHSGEVMIVEHWQQGEIVHARDIANILSRKAWELRLQELNLSCPKRDDLGQGAARHIEGHQYHACVNSMRSWQ